MKIGCSCWHMFSVHNHGVSFGFNFVFLDSKILKLPGELPKEIQLPKDIQCWGWKASDTKMD